MFVAFTFEELDGGIEDGPAQVELLLRAAVEAALLDSASPGGPHAVAHAHNSS